MEITEREHREYVARHLADCLKLPSDSIARGMLRELTLQLPFAKCEWVNGALLDLPSAQCAKAIMVLCRLPSALRPKAMLALNCVALPPDERIELVDRLYQLSNTKRAEVVTNL